MASASVQGQSLAVPGERRVGGCSRTCSPEMHVPQVRRGWCLAPRELGWPTLWSRPKVAYRLGRSKGCSRTQISRGGPIRGRRHDRRRA